VGTIEGVAIGAIFIITINNVINLIGVPHYLYEFIKGVIIILVVGIDTLRNKVSSA
jgi:ribose/xylose/arabinose/galactoside ABC-type transport system permease subunit